VLGEGGIASADTRRWQSGPHLRRSLDLLGGVFGYLERINVSMYRLPSQTIPYGTHPDLPEFDYRRQLDEAAEPLTAIAAEATRLGLRLSTHPGQYTVLNATDPAIVDKAIADLEQDATLLDALDQPAEGSVVVHVGGSYGAPAAAVERWERAWWRLSDRARARLALENDERLFGLDDVMALHERTGVRVVLDVHHHRIHPASSGISARDAIHAAYRTWPSGTRPKVHLSSPRTMLEQTPRGKGRGPGAVPPLRAHADLVVPWDLSAVLDVAPGPLDVMLEAKAKDIALLNLRQSIQALRPDIAAAEERREQPARERPGDDPAARGFSPARETP
jgi:UV DNA damage endonuclease